MYEKFLVLGHGNYWLNAPPQILRMNFTTSIYLYTYKYNYNLINS